MLILSLRKLSLIVSQLPSLKRKQEYYSPFPGMQEFGSLFANRVEYTNIFPHAFRQTNAAFHFPWKSEFEAGNDTIPDLPTFHLCKMEKQYGRLQEDQFYACTSVVYWCFTANQIKICP